MSLAAKREAVTLLGAHGVSQRRACALAGMSRATWQYQARPDQDTDLQARLQHLAHQHPRWGVRKAYWLLRRDGQAVNHKRVQRLWTQAGLQVRPRKHRVYKPPKPQPLLVVATRPGEVWSLDFVADATQTGAKLRILTVGDDFTRVCLAVEVASAFPATRVQRVLAGLLTHHAAPTYLRSDNGPEFIEAGLKTWLVAHAIVPMAYAERVSNVSLEMIYAHKESTNRWWDAMGIASAMAAANDADAMAIAGPAMADFKKIQDERGVRAAVEDRDEPFSHHRTYWEAYQASKAAAQNGQG